MKIAVAETLCVVDYVGILDSTVADYVDKLRCNAVDIGGQAAAGGYLVADRRLAVLL